MSNFTAKAVVMSLRRVVELRHRVSGEPVAFFQDLVDFVLCPLSESGRPAGAQGLDRFAAGALLWAGLTSARSRRAWRGISLSASMTAMSRRIRCAH